MADQNTKKGQNGIISKIRSFLTKLGFCKKKEVRQESPTEKSKLISFLKEEEKNRLNEKSEIKTPKRLIVDGEEWDLEDFSYQTANQILEKLYSGQYTRIEITYQEFYERKGHRIPLNMTSLVYLCEDGKAVMQYSEEKDLFTGIFFENRNGAGMVDSNLLPCTNFRGKEIYEQNIVLDRSILGNVCVEMFLEGCIDYEINIAGGRDRKTGYFSGRYFSNKNAYIKCRDEKGEF